MPAFRLALPVSAPVSTVWALVSDIPRFSNLFPYLTVEEITQTAPDCWSVLRHLSLPGMTPLAWREVNHVLNDRTVRFEAVDGDLKTFTGRWRVDEQDGRAVLDLALEYEIPAAAGTQLPAGLAQYVMNELLTAVCHRVREVAEGGAS